MRFGIIIASIIFLFGTAAVVAGISTYNDLNAQEIGVRTVWRDSAVQYDNGWKEVKEKAQVSDKYASDFKEALIKSVEGRYEGKDPAMQWITESNPNLSPELYASVAASIETFRNEFAQTQRTLTDRQRRYETSLTTFPNVLMSSILGFPREQNGSDYRPTEDRDGDGVYSVLDYPTVTSQRTKRAFSTGEDDAIDVF